MSKKRHSGLPFVFIFLFNIGTPHLLYSSEKTKTEILLGKLSNARHDTTWVNILLKLAQDPNY